MGADREEVSSRGMSTFFQDKRRSGGWLLGLLLLAYFILKIQSFVYSRATHDLEKELNALRPALSAAALQEHLQSNREVYRNVFEQIRRKRVPAERLFSHFSETLPVSVTIREYTFFSSSDLAISGDFYPGAREPEEALITWLQPFQMALMRIQIRSAYPISDGSGRWQFEIEVKNA